MKFEKYEAVLDKYMPASGEGETIASQIATAVNKIIYKWYNDGDVYDNVNSPMNGWANDLSSYANWLMRYIEDEEVHDILCRIAVCHTDEDYETLVLEPLADATLHDWYLEPYSKMEKVGSIYKCEGPFEFEEELDEWW